MKKKKIGFTQAYGFRHLQWIVDNFRRFELELNNTIRKQYLRFDAKLRISQNQLWLYVVLDFVSMKFYHLVNSWVI